MGLHKRWLADKPQRNPVKRDKDRRQGNALLDAVRYFKQMAPVRPRTINAPNGPAGVRLRQSTARNTLFFRVLFQ
jgi:hypothetical protein